MELASSQRDDGRRRQPGVRRGRRLERFSGWLSEGRATALTHAPRGRGKVGQRLSRHEYRCSWRELRITRGDWTMVQAASEKATRAWVLALTAAASFMVSLDSQVVAAALN